MIGRETYLARWARRPVETRDRQFYLIALPAAVAIVGLAPHAIQFLFFPDSETGLLKLSFQVVIGAVMIGVICYGVTRFLSNPRWWGPSRSKWPLVQHILLLWIPAALLVDAPMRLSELSMIGPSFNYVSIAPYILGVSMGRAFLFAGGIVFYERLVGAVLEAVDERQRALWLETQTLKNLIQPHFLLNSLNAVRAYIEDSPGTAEKMLLNLTSLLRHVIQYSSMEKITLKEEMDVIADYVAVMNQRFEGDFKLRVDGMRDVAIHIPPLIIFSLVENSFKHGFAGVKNGLIHITVEAAERIRFVVNDNGEANRPSNSGGGTGGQYVQSRLELKYGSDFHFIHGRKEDGHYEAIVEIPWEKA